jgi:O-antigen/teichoic acid export membrane protein
VPAYGLIGLAYARVGQAGALVVATWFMLRRLVPKLPVIPYRWNRKLFSEMVGYGLNLQAISISQLFYDPITKSLLTKFGGLAMTGFYEMASRMVLQVRALLVSANQVLVPTIADLQEKDPKIIQKVYKDSYDLLFYIALPLFSILIALTPVISQLWIGEYEDVFVTFSILLALGWFLNTLMAPAYFANLGIGELRWNTTGDVLKAILNLGLGLLLGSIYGGIGVVSAWVVSLVLGSAIIVIAYHYRHAIPMMELLPRGSIGITLAAISALGTSLALYHGLNGILTSLAMAVVLVLIFAGIVFVPLWLHPMRRRVMNHLMHLLRGVS